VACLGYDAIPRSFSVRFLNALYDGIDWQLAAAHDATIAYVGQPCSIDVYTSCNDDCDLTAVRVLLCGPSFDRGSNATIDHILTLHAPVSCTREDAWIAAGIPEATAEDTRAGTVIHAAMRFERSSVIRVRLDLATFTRCGQL
jgi:hypothetical protein